jgi:hypothetical protein
VGVVVSRMHKQLQRRSADIDRLVGEREQIEKFYKEKYDATVRCLAQEQEKAVASAQAKKRELQRSMEMEQETTQELLAEEKKNEEIRETLDMTVTQLEKAQSEMTSFQASEIQAPQAQTVQRVMAAPEVRYARDRIQTQLKEKEETFNERQALQAEIRKVMGELECQRLHAAKLEDFVRKLTQGTVTTGYLLDPASKREAAAIMASAAKLQPSRSQRPASSPREREEHGDADYGARYVAYEGDSRWPPPAVGHCPPVR